MTYREAMAQARKTYLRQLLLQNPNMRKAAEVAGMDRTWLYKLLVRTGVKRPTPSKYHRPASDVRPLLRLG